MKIEVRYLQKGYEISSFGGNAIVKGVLETSGEYCTVFLQMPDGRDRVAYWKPRTKIKVHNLSN